MVIAVSLVLAVFGGYEYLDEKENKLSALHDLAERIADRLSENLVLPLWELDSSWVNKVIDTEMSEKHIFAIYVKGEGNIVVSKINDNVQPPFETESEEELAEFIVSYRDIFHNDENIGSVEIVLSRDYVRQELKELAIHQLINTLVLIWLIIILLLFSLDRIVIRPVNKFVKVVKAISNGDYSSRINIRQQNEIAELANSVNQMQAEILKREQALRESEQNYIDLYDYAPDMYVSVNVDNALVERCNQTLMTNLGYKREEIVGHPIFKLYHRDSLENAKKVFQSFIVMGSINDVELQLLRKNGTKLDVSLSVTAIRDNKGNIVKTRSTWRDITLRKRMENELRLLNQELEQRVTERTRALNKQHIFLETVLENIRDGVVACDEKGILSLFNQATRYIHGISEEKLPPEQWANYYNLFKADGKTAMTMEDIPLFKAFNGENINGVEMVIKPKNAMPRLVQVFGRPMFDSDNHKLGAVISMHDITEQKKIEQALQKAVKDAEKANHAKSVFLANMSHELRTPLNAIIGFSQLMQGRPGLPSSDNESLKIINRSGEHLLKLINDVLDMSKIEAGQITLEPVDFDLGEMLRDVTDMMRLRAVEKGLRLFLDQSSAFPRFIHADSAKVRQIFTNLLSNAVKYTNEGEICLRLNVKKRSGQQLLLSCEIEDTGIGMSIEDQQRIFQPFIQLGQSFNQTGTGLGLAISKKFISMMGGEITVRSELGKGSVFQFTMKAEVVEQGNVVLTEELDVQDIIGLQPGQTEFRILIVEDQIESQLLLERLLKPIGFKVKIAHNGKEAVEIFKDWHPHFIWMDQRMPVMDGLEATRYIKNMPEGRKTKIVILTASVLGKRQKLAFESGADGFVGKPYKIHEIFDCMKKHLGVRYLYTDSPKASSEISVLLNQETLKGLGDEILKSLSEAVIALDIEQALGEIEKIKAINKKVAVELKKLVDNLDFESLQKLLVDRED